MPIIFFAVLFGLSMDYEVFLLSRIREEYDATVTTPRRWLGHGGHGARDHLGRADHDGGVRRAVADPSPLVKMLGLGLSTAIVLDATIVRMVLVPATMALMGRATGGCPAGSTAGRPTRMETPTSQGSRSQSSSASPSAADAWPAAGSPASNYGRDAGGAGQPDPSADHRQAGSGPRLREPPGPGDRSEPALLPCTCNDREAAGLIVGHLELAEDGKTMKFYQVTDRYPPFRLAQ